VLYVLTTSLLAPGVECRKNKIVKEKNKGIGWFQNIGGKEQCQRQLLLLMGFAENK
jgi:hypothetical protein